MKNDLPDVDFWELHQKGVRWPEETVRLMEVFESLFKRKKIAQEPKKLALEAALALSFYCGGRHIYVPRGHHIKVLVRDAEICARFLPGKAIELAEEYGITDRHVHRIIETRDRISKAKREGKQPAS